MYKFNIKGNEGFETTIDKVEKDGVDYISFKIEAPNEVEFPYMSIEVRGINGSRAHSYWKPAQFRNKNVIMCWGEADKGDPVKGSISAPVGVFFDLEGKNALAASYSNVLEDTNFKMGVIEESGELIVRVGLFPYKSKKRKSYEGCLRLDRRELDIENVIGDISRWYEGINKPMEVPNIAREAMYSTWYSYHQDITDEAIEKEASLAKKAGMEAIIVDDGWQTEDSNRGYAYCGDWEVSEKRIKNMPDHVKKVQDMGVKYLLWYSVPFMGMKAKVWSRFEDKMLYLREELECGVLDPRYKEVREYLIGKYVEAVRDFGVDGLKLDFIDEFHQGKATGAALLEDDRRDYGCVQEAVEALMSETVVELKKIKEDVMVEFRQRYIGPFMRSCGNIFRVCDCPMDFVTNRLGIADLRMFSGDTAIHSDMIMWDPKDTPEGAALQFASIMFGVPQFSMRMDELSDDHKRVTEFWLGLWNRNKELLTRGEFRLKSLEYMCPLISSEDRDKIAIGIYGDVVVEANGDKEILLINGRLEEKTYLDLKIEKRAKIRVFNSMGDIVKDGEILLNKGINRLDIPECGVAEIRYL